MRARTRTMYAVLAALGVAAVAAVWLLVGGKESTSLSTTAGVPSPTTVHVAEPAGANPSKSAEMVCASEAAKDIASTLGAATIDPLKPTWVDHVYSCRYVYAQGVMVVSVKELSDEAETAAYFTSLQSQLGQHVQFPAVGQGGFVAKNGSFVARKDYKVLVVDPTGLPAPFGSPARQPADVATDVGFTLLGCWTGG